MNSRNFASKSPYEKALKQGNEIYNYLIESLDFLKNLKIISKNENYFKFIKGLQLTIKAQIMLIDHLTENHDVDFILTGRTNQDSLEIFFSRLRGKEVSITPLAATK